MVGLSVVGTVYMFLHTLSQLSLSVINSLRGRVHMNIINNYVFVFSISLLLYCTEATDFSHTIMWSAAYFSAQTALYRILPFVTPDSYVLCYIRLLISPWLYWHQSYRWISCHSTPNVVNWQKPPPTHTLMDPQPITRWGPQNGCSCTTSTGSFGKLNGMQKSDVTNILSCIIVPYLNARKTT